MKRCLKEVGQILLTSLLPICKRIRSEMLEHRRRFRGLRQHARLNRRFASTITSKKRRKYITAVLSVI
jgi:hypothetical protein